MKKIFLLIISLLVLSACDLTGSSDPVEKTNETATPTPTVAEETTPAVENSTEVIEPESGLLTYRNSDLGFEISYPSVWIKEERSVQPSFDTTNESDWLIWLMTKETQAIKDSNEHPTSRYDADVQIKVYNSIANLPSSEQNKLSFEDWISKEADSYGFVERSPIIIDGVNGYKGVASGETYGNYMEFVKNNGKIYEISISGTATEEEMKIVNSFKFIK